MLFKRISIVGSGNLCWHLLQLLHSKKDLKLTVYARDTEKLEALATEFPGITTWTLTKDLIIEGDLIVLAIKDDALESIKNYAIDPKAYLIHLSGARSLQSIATIPCAGSAVVYPFQTFTKGRPVHWRQIPVFVEGSSAAIEEQLMAFLEELRLSPYKADLETRKQIHLCGVLVNNFTYYMFNQALQLMEAKGLDKKMLSPILTETVSKFLELDDPSVGQSGPASRKDFKTIGKHLELLEKFPNLKSAYEELTKAIINRQ
ncbi:MAG: protein of unknown function DUF2520-containing protein [Cytophagaceae bacterium]|jgi:predicted short-subunit dehydrogenase-like oxidoreductase (DUF2520 family)|nr:protein of unknown function DUF2520-containing protein [Cytophagaceae bacterium]